jgi:DNA repair photolyase
MAREQLFELRRRTFDTPSFRGIEFIEVEAKSIINHVPGSYLPFNWTINPYRGCSHACVYCMAGDTPILMADGRTKCLADVRVGDAVYGTQRQGAYRRYVATEVLNHWTTVKPAYRITLGEGSELIASGDHRFLSNRGWKYVTGTEQGTDQRPHLTPNDYLMGPGESLRGLGGRSRYSMERREGSNPVGNVLVVGGAQEHLPFFRATDPAIWRKRSIVGRAPRDSGRQRVVSVEDLGVELPMFDITTGTGDFIANGVVSHNCFARVTHTYMDMDAGRDFETKIVVKVNAADRLRRELRAKRWKGEHIAMGTATDPYQRAEGRYKLMPAIIRGLAEVGNPFSILTKGTLILRDLDLLVEAAGRSEISTALSIGTLDEDAWRRSEPGTPHPRKRMEAVAKLNQAGIPCGVMVAPVLPGITDRPEQLRAVVSAALDAGATHVSPILLHLRPGVKDVYMRWLRDNFPELEERYRSMYQKSAYGPQKDKDYLGAAVGDLVRAREPGRRAAPRLVRRAEPKVEVEQLRLM